MNHAKRRRFLLAMGALLAAPLARAQRPGRPFRVGWPAIAPLHTTRHLLDALELGLRDHGYVVGRDIVVEVRSADGKIERYPEVVQEIVRSKPDVIVTGVNANTTAVKAATQSIPIVMAIGTDVIAAGYVTSLAKPGGNITGLTWDVGGGTVAKALELLRDIAPKISRVAVLWEPPYEANYRTPLDKAATVLGLSTFWLAYSGDLERDFAEVLRSGADAVYSLTGPRVYGRRAEMVALAAKHRLPATYVVSEFVDAGGLMTYSASNAAAFRAAARYVDKILKGAKPGDLPVEQPTKIDLVINLKTAKTLGLKIPQSVLLRADRVIE